MILMRRIFKYTKGYSIIELLIVMSLLGITTTLVSAAYLSFEKRERVKKAALDIKTDLRLAQSKALSGDKGITGTPQTCEASYTLVGWFLRFNPPPSSSYDIVGACQVSPGAETEFSVKNVKFPEGVTLTQIWYDGLADSSLAGANILFRTLEREIYAFKLASTPPFLDASGNLRELIVGAGDQESVKLSLSDNNGTTWEITIFTNGEINEKKL